MGTRKKTRKKTTSTRRLERCRAYRTYRTRRFVRFTPALLVVPLFTHPLPTPPAPFITDDLFRDCLEETFIHPVINQPVLYTRLKPVTLCVTLHRRSTDFYRYAYVSAPQHSELISLFLFLSRREPVDLTKHEDPKGGFLQSSRFIQHRRFLSLYGESVVGFDLCFSLILTIAVIRFA